MVKKCLLSERTAITMRIARTLEEYAPHVGEKVIAEIYEHARKLYGTKIVHINSTYQGGGVAEMLLSLVPLMNYVGLEAEWRIISGRTEFFNVTKRIHNCLQGEAGELTPEEQELHIRTNETFSEYTKIEHDAVIVHDPQPAPLIRFYKKRQPWIWRCHIDLSNPNTQVWSYLKQFILRYDRLIFSHEKYQPKNFPVKNYIIRPAIDPLIPKNQPLSDQEIEKLFKEFEIPTDKPIIAQVSRFDKWKDPEGVIDIFKQVKKEIDCRLILIGSMASDDPEGWQIYENVLKKAGSLIENREIILITIQHDLLVNAIQRKANVIIQKSLREGFGLTVTETLWKGRPVVASNVGGIPLQVKDGVNGFLLDPYDYTGFSEKIIYLLRHPETATRLGKAGKEIVREHFLITRLLKDYLKLLNDVFY